MVDFEKLHVFDFERAEDMGYIYFLFHGKELIYIGQTVSLISRIGSHRASKHFTGVKYELCKLSELTAREKELINNYNPIINGTPTKVKKERCRIIGNYLHVAGEGSFQITETKLLTKSGKVWGYRKENTLAEITKDSHDKIVVTYIDIPTGAVRLKITEKVKGRLYKFNLVTFEVEQVAKQKPPLNHIFPVGRYKGMMVKEINHHDKQYVAWYTENVYNSK